MHLTKNQTEELKDIFSSWGDHINFVEEEPPIPDISPTTDSLDLLGVKANVDFVPGEDK